MIHPIASETRLVAPATRLFRRFFSPHDPHGWADYHSVEQPDGTLWIHCHGPRRQPDLELVCVPPDLRAHAHQLMFGIMAQGRALGGFGPDMDVEGAFSLPLQSFRQMATLRAAPCEDDDTDHRGMLRVVDWDQPLDSGFPRRLFASHIAAWAEFARDPGTKEAMCRRALAIFPGHFMEMTAGEDIRPDDADLTDPQFQANLTAYISLAHALFDQGRGNEGISYLQEAVARCPGWARVYRDHLLVTYSNDDRYIQFWRNVDIEQVCAELYPASMIAPPPAAPKLSMARPATKRVKKTA